MRTKSEPQGFKKRYKRAVLKETVSTCFIRRWPIGVFFSTFPSTLFVLKQNLAAFKDGKKSAMSFHQHDITAD